MPSWSRVLLQRLMAGQQWIARTSALGRKRARMLNSAVIEAFSRARVIVLGDVMLDRFVFGDVSRISPEAPIPVFCQQRVEMMLGGAGNVARNVVQLGGQAMLLSVLGADTTSRTIISTAEDERIGAIFVTDARRAGTIKTRFVAQGHQMLRVDAETVERISPDIEDSAMNKLRELLPNSDILVCSDYAKGVLTPSLLQRAIAAARQAGVRTIVDPKAADFSVYAGASIVTPNAAEASKATGIDCSDDEGVVRAARAIRQSTSCEAVVITRGAAGMSIFASDGARETVTHLPTKAREVHDVSGAGDTTIAVFALACVSGADFVQAARLANAAAGIAVGKAGTATVSGAELANALVDSELAHSADKIVGIDEAAKAAKAWQSQGLKVVFTNGCFDLLHPGHVKLVEQARAAGDRLIVGLNTDRSVRKLKGITRPIQDERGRLRIVASLAAVDKVLLFDQDTPYEVIQKIDPDVLVKGGDYRESEIVGGDLVRGRGGQILIVDLESGHSTTDLVRRASQASDASYDVEDKTPLVSKTFS